MKNRIKKTLIIILLVSLILQPVVPATASLESDMGDMFQRWGFRQNITEPGAYNAQARGFLTGGRVTAKAPTSNIQPFTFKAPDFKAGCGGIDIFGGSFSFINVNEFTDRLQAIGQNAVGYAFQMGIEAVCPTCNSMLKDLRAKMDQLNALALNSCTAAKALVNTAVDVAMEGELQACNSANVETGSSKYDPSAGYLSCISDKTPQEVLTGNRNREAYPTIPGVTITGTGTYDATVNQALQKTDLTPEQRQIAMSIAGTWATEDPDQGGGYVSNCKYYKPSIGLKDLVNGGTVTLLKCGSGSLEDGNACQSIETETKTIDGYAKIAKNQMQAIITSLRSNTPLTDDQKKFVNSVPVVPVQKMLESLVETKSTDLADSVIDYSSEVIGLMVSSEFIEEYLKKIEEGSYKINACATEKENVRATLGAVRMEKYQLFQEYTKVFDFQLNFMRFVANLDQKITQIASGKVLRALQYGT